MIIGTAGHIDHGKTALVKALTGVDTDRLPEEKKRGITLDLGFAPIALDGVGAASVIDVPGHEAFVKTMISGAAGIDVALLVIAADEGVMAQTREHFAILEVLAIPRLVVAITKSDLVDAEWLRLVSDEIAELLAKSPWPSSSIVPCSALTGEGIADLRSALAISAGSSSARDAGDLFRLPVDRSFTLKGIGTVVTGSVWSGCVDQDSEVRILPGGIRARVRRLHRHGKQVASVGPGERAAVALTGVDVADVPRGSILVTDPAWTESSTIDASVTLFADGHARLRPRSKLFFQLAGAELASAVSFARDSDAGGAERFARIKLDTPIACRGGDRFVLRLPAPIGTVGGGVVLDPHSPRAPINSTSRIFADADSRAVRLAGDPATRLRAILDPAARLAALLELAGRDGIDLASISVRVGCAPAAAPRMIADAGAIVAPDKVFSSAALSALKERVVAAVKAAETTISLVQGVKRESVRVSLGCPPELFERAVTDLEVEGILVSESHLLRSRGWTPVLSGAEQKTIESLVHAICASGNEPPSASELEKEFGGEVPGLLRYLEREGRVVQVDADRFYARESLDDLIAKLRKGLTPGVEYAPSQLRDMLGFSRKYLIPFLEYCDRAGITERKGDGRALRSRAKA